MEAGAKIPEADPENSSVGFGGLPDEQGKVTLDACIMDHTGNCGSVAFLQNIKHPISVARKVMEETTHVMLAGEGARQFAISQGFEEMDLLTENSREKWERWKKEQFKQTPHDTHDTISVLAQDSKGNLSGACTTSGWAYKLHGRVGDSPIIGAGLYVDNEIGCAAATGLGEEVIKTTGSFLVVELMRQGYDPTDACKEALTRIIKNHSGKLDFQSVLEESFNPYHILGLVFILSSNVVAAFRWRYLLHLQGLSFRSAVVIRWVMIGDFFGLTLPGGAGTEITLAFYLFRNAPNAKTAALSSLFLDRILSVTSLMSMGFLSFLVLLISSDTVDKTILVLGIVMGTVLLGIVLGFFLIGLRPVRKLIQTPLSENYRQVVDNIIIT